VDKISNQESSEYFNKIKRADSINEVRPVYSNSPVIKQNYITLIESPTKKRRKRDSVPN